MRARGTRPSTEVAGGVEGGGGGGTRTVRVANCWHDVDGATREGDASVTEDTRGPTSEASFSVGTLGRGRRGDSGVPLLETGRVAKGAAAATATYPAAGLWQSPLKT